MSCEIHIADVGTIFRQQVTDCGSITDISGANSIVFCFQKPDETIVTVAATFTGVGTDGLAQYTVAASSFLDQEGGWGWQSIIYFPTGAVFHSELKEFEVVPNICE